MVNKIDEYKKYRAVGIEFVNEVIKYSLSLQENIIIHAAKLLGLECHGKTIIFEHESEMGVLMDFLLHEYRIDGHSCLEMYRNNVPLKNHLEKSIMDSWLASYTSLFKIESISLQQNVINLSDIMTENHSNIIIPIIDINFSNTASVGTLLFFRLLPTPNFSMTSGVSFPFAATSDKIIKQYKTIYSKTKGHSDSMKRFIVFRKLYHKYGLPVHYR